MIGLAWNERSSVELPCPETDALAPGLVLCVRHASQLIAKVVPWTRERLRCGRSSEQSDESRPSESLDGSLFQRSCRKHTLLLIRSASTGVRVRSFGSGSASVGRGWPEGFSEALGSVGIAIWLILPVVIRSSQRLSHACLSISDLVL